MSPKNTKSRPTPSGHEAEVWQSGLLVGSLSLLLLLTPIVYRLTTRLIEEDFERGDNLNVFAFIVTLIFSITFMLLSNSYIKHFSQNVLQEYQQQLRSFQDHQQKQTFFFKIFPLFANNLQPSSSSSTNNQANDKGSSSLFSSNNQESDSRRKIDPKYFKPKFIIHELITFWDTTCTVITWGSFYVIGGTIVATEKITQRIKTRPKSASHSSSFSIFGDNNNRNSGRGTGQSDFSFGSAFGSTSQSNPSTSEQQHEQQQQQQNRQPFKWISSWSKRSINSIKKKYSRATRSNAPQLTSGSANDSNSSIFFFTSNPSTAAAS